VSHVLIEREEKVFTCVKSSCSNRCSSSY